MAGFSVIGAKQLQAAFVKVGVQADMAAKATVQAATKQFLADAKGGFEGSHKRGQPHVGGNKPNVVTGNLRRSIRNSPLEHVGMGEYRTSAGPSMEYGRRVELGFEGPDSLGRAYHQRAFPYIDPAYKKLHENLPALLADNWKRYVM